MPRQSRPGIARVVVREEGGVVSSDAGQDVVVGESGGMVKIGVVLWHQEEPGKSVGVQ